MWCGNTQLSMSELMDTMRNYTIRNYALEHRVFLNDFLSAVTYRDNNNKVVMETCIMRGYYCYVSLTIWLYHKPDSHFLVSLLN